MRSLGKVLWDSFKSIRGPTVTVLGVIGFFLIFFQIEDNPTVGVKWMVLLGVILLVVIATLFDAVNSLIKESTPPYPELRMSVQEESVAKGVTLLFTPSRIFMAGQVVSLWHTNEGGMQRSLGLGEVSLIQDNGMIQVSPLDGPREREEIWEGIRGNDVNVLGSVTVRPIVLRPAPVSEYEPPLLDEDVKDA